MWNFLRPGQTGSRAVQTLEALVQDVNNLAGGMPADPKIAANAYLMWTEKAEQHLAATFRSSDVQRVLQTERYWRISAITEATMRPLPMIRAEIDYQSRLLQDLLAQLIHYTSILERDDDHRLVVPDTNVYIHGQLFHEVEWHREVSAPKATVVMPLVVLDELDRVKDRDLEFGRRAASILRAIDRLTEEREWLASIQLRPRVWFQLVDEPFGHQRQPGQDDEIVRQAEYFSQLNGGRLTLLTRDRGMRVRAQAAGLHSKTLPRRLERIERSSHG